MPRLRPHDNPGGAREVQGSSSRVKFDLADPRSQHLHRRDRSAVVVYPRNLVLGDAGRSRELGFGAKSSPEFLRRSVLPS